MERGHQHFEDEELKRDSELDEVEEVGVSPEIMAESDGMQVSEEAVAEEIKEGEEFDYEVNMNAIRGLTESDTLDNEGRGQESSWFRKAFLAGTAGLAMIATACGSSKNDAMIADANARKAEAEARKAELDLEIAKENAGGARYQADRREEQMRLAANLRKQAEDERIERQLVVEKSRITVKKEAEKTLTKNKGEVEKKKKELKDAEKELKAKKAEYESKSESYRQEVIETVKAAILRIEDLKKEQRSLQKKYDMTFPPPGARVPITAKGGGLNPGEVEHRNELYEELVAKKDEIGVSIEKFQKEFGPHASSWTAFNAGAMRAWANRRRGAAPYPVSVTIDKHMGKIAQDIGLNEKELQINGLRQEIAELQSKMGIRAYGNRFNFERWHKSGKTK
jgi:hypothetical protein